MEQVLTRIKRGTFEGSVIQEKNQYFATVSQAGKKIKDAGPFYDQDEAEVELGTLIDTAWREMSRPNAKLVRRV